MEESLQGRMNCWVNKSRRWSWSLICIYYRHFSSSCLLCYKQVLCVPCLRPQATSSISSDIWHLTNSITSPWPSLVIPIYQALSGLLSLEACCVSFANQQLPQPQFGLGYCIFCLLLGFVVKIPDSENESPHNNIVLVSSVSGIWILSQLYNGIPTPYPNLKIIKIKIMYSRFWEW